MVVIINGEIVADSDPRAQAMRRTGSAQPQQRQTQQQPRGGFGSLNQDAAQSGNGAGFGGLGSGPDTSGPDGIFSPVAKVLGLEGKTFTIPSMFGMAEQRIPLVVLIIAAAVASLAGLRMAAAFVLITWIYLQNREGQGQGQSPPTGGN